VAVPMQMATTTMVSGSYVPPVVPGSCAAPPMIMSGSYCGPPMSGSYSAPPPMMARSGSYTGAPPMMAPGAYGAPQVMYGAPPMVVPGGGMSGSYTAPPPVDRNLPDPDTVTVQKGRYETALDKQYQQALAQIEQERDSKKALLRQGAEQHKEQFSYQARSQLEAKKLELDTALNCQLVGLQETAMNHRKALEEKASTLTLDFQTRKANEELLQKQYDIQKAFSENERNLAVEFQKKHKPPAKAPAKPEKS